MNEVNQPFVSFIVPAYNVEKYIKKTIESLLKQTEDDFELIVIDDGSTDHTCRIVEEFLKKASFKNYRIIKKENGGVSSARNVGIRNALGKYLIFLDGDDYVAPGLVEKIKTVTSKDTFDMVLWKFESVSEENVKESLQFPQHGLKERIIYDGLEILRKIFVEKNFWIWTTSAAYLREMIVKNNLFYNEKLTAGEDIEFIIKSLANSSKITFIDDTLSYYVQRSGSITKTFDERRFDSYIALIEARKYLSQKLNKKEENISEILENIHRFALNDFLYVFRQVHKKLKCPSYSKMEKLLSSKHENLLNIVLLDTRTNFKIRTKIGRNEIWVEIFKISPRIYALLTWILDKAKKYLNFKTKVRS